MPAYRFNNPICAVVLKSQTATQFPATTILRVIEPSKVVNGLVNVECKGEPFAVFLTDLKQSGERVHATGSKHPRILISQLLILQKAYSEALRKYADVLGKRTLAVVTGDHELARQLIASLEEVAVSCARAKTALIRAGGFVLPE
jgi:alkaline phosphatase